MRVAVFGARGFIGRRLCAALSTASIDVAAFSSTSGDCFNPISGILREPAVDRTIDAVVYLSQSPDYRDLPSRATHVWGVNVVSAVVAAGWARRCGAARFIYASSGSVYQAGFHAHRETDPVRRDDWYALSKVHGEEAVGLYEPDLQVVRARLFAVYGPAQRSMLVPRLIDSVRNRTPIRLHPHVTDQDGPAGIRLSLCYVDDAVAAFLRLLVAEQPPTVVNIAGAQSLSIREIAETIGRQVEVPPVFQVEPTARAHDLIADPSLLQQLLGREPTRFESGIVPTIAEHVASTPGH